MALETLGKKIKLLITLLRRQFARLNSPTHASESQKMKMMMQQAKLENWLDPIEYRLQHIEFYRTRKGSKLVDILKELRSRVSFYNVYHLSERENLRQLDSEFERGRVERLAERLDQHDRILAELKDN